MREYLEGFFKEFEYDGGDVSELLAAYDATVGNGEAALLLKEALSAYEGDIALDYKAEILGRAKRIAEATGLHPYTADLLVFICMTKHLKEVYAERGIDMRIYRDSVLDLKWKLQECRAVKGVCGSFVASWFSGFFNMTRFALGRLQFETVTVNFDYEKDGVKLEKDKSLAINVHIPRTGTPLDKDSGDRSYAQARAFFADKAGENAPFVCSSWLLYPENKKILSPKSNTFRFMSEYDIVKWKTNTGEDLWRLFDTDEKNPVRLPADSSFRARYAEHLKKGGRVGTGVGVKK